LTSLWHSPRRAYRAGLDAMPERDPFLTARVSAERNRPSESIVRETSDPWRSIEFRMVRLPEEPWTNGVGHRRAG
jgi:hypothetical protein